MTTRAVVATALAAAALFAPLAASAQTPADPNAPLWARRESPPAPTHRATSAGATPRAGAIDRGACLSVSETWVPPQPRNPPLLET